MSLTEKQQACRDEQYRLNGLYALLDGAQKADFMRRWDIMNALPSGFLPHQRDIRDLEAAAKKERALTDKLTIGIVVGVFSLLGLNFLFGNGFHLPEWAQIPVYIAAALLFANRLVITPLNKQLLVNAHHGKQSYAFQARAVGVSPYLLIKWAQLILLKDNEDSVPLPDDYPEQLLEMSNQITQQILDAVLREPKNLYFDWTANY